MSKPKSIIKENNKVLCLKCKKMLAPTNFYKNSKKEVLPYCKKCVFEMSTNDKDILMKKKFQSALKLINKPFMNTIWNDIKKLESPEIDKFRRYMYSVSRTNYSNLYWSDSVFDDTDRDTETDVVDSYMVKKDKWGFTDSVDLDFLENEYSDWETNYEVDTKALSEVLKQICIIQLQLRKANVNGSSTTQLRKDLQDLLGTANLKPVQETGMQAGDTQTFGVFIKTIENDRPLMKRDNKKPDWYDEMEIWWIGQTQKMAGYQDKISESYEKELSKYTIKELNLDGKEDSEEDGE